HRRVVRIVLDDEQRGIPGIEDVAIVGDVERAFGRQRRGDVRRTRGDLRTARGFAFGRPHVMQRQVEDEGAAFARRTLQPDLAAEQAGDFATDGEPEAGAAVTARGARIGLLERLEHDLLLLRQADAGTARRYGGTG